MKPEDSQLIRQAAKGKKAAIAELYARHERYWFRICLRYGRNRSEGQDMFQEGVAKVFEKLKKYDPKRGSFEIWSNRVIVNEALQYLRRNQWQQSFEDLELAGDEESEMESSLDQISARELTEMIQSLPSGYRAVFNLYEIEGYSHQEIAAQLNISVGTSKSQLYKARHLLQRKLNVLFQ